MTDRALELAEKLRECVWLNGSAYGGFDTARAAELIREAWAAQRHDPPDEAAIRERCEKVLNDNVRDGYIEAGLLTLIRTDIPALLDKLTALREKVRALVEACRECEVDEILGGELQALAELLEEPCQKK